MYIWPFGRKPEAATEIATLTETATATKIPTDRARAEAIITTTTTRAAVPTRTPTHYFTPVTQMATGIGKGKSDAFYSDKMGLPRPAAARSVSTSISGRAPRRSRAIVALLFIGMFIVWILYPGLARLNYRERLSMRKGIARPEQGVIADKPAATTSRVPLEAHIMSKCPDAQDCLVDLVVPVMERTSHMVDWKLSFIGEVGRDDSVHCKHGEEECLGNVMMLCAARLYPDPKISLGFSTCLIKEYEDIPQRSLVESCALEHAVDFNLLNGCVSEEGDGLDLLKASFQRSKDSGVKYSCTIRLDDHIRCIRDDGQWVNCDEGSEPSDLIKDITALYDSSK